MPSDFDKSTFYFEESSFYFAESTLSFDEASPTTERSPFGLGKWHAASTLSGER
jgi:hypothetical protein